MIKKDLQKQGLAFDVVDDMNVNKMEFDNTQEKEFIMRNIKNVFKKNAQEAKEK